MPCSSAIRRTTGEYRRGALSATGASGREATLKAGVGVGAVVADVLALAVDRFSTGGGAAAVAGAGEGGRRTDRSAGGSAAGADARDSAWADAATDGFAPVAAPAESMTAISAPTGRVWPSLATICVITPDPGEGISVSTLSVEISHSGWSSLTRSPSLTSHLVTVPSTTLSPIWGIVTSSAILIRRQATDRFHDLVGIGQDCLFERRAERRMGVHGRQPPNRAIERIEGVLADQRRDFAAEAAGQAILMDDKNFAGLARGSENRFAIERQ